MPRALRIEYPGACYPVICRSDARRPIFHADSDKELLLDRMVHFAKIGSKSKSEGCRACFLHIYAILVAIFGLNMAPRIANSC